MDKKDVDDVEDKYGPIRMDKIGYVADAMAATADAFNGIAFTIKHVLPPAHTKKSKWSKEEMDLLKLGLKELNDAMDEIHRRVERRRMEAERKNTTSDEFKETLPNFPVAAAGPSDVDENFGIESFFNESENMALLDDFSLLDDTLPLNLDDPYALDGEFFQSSSAPIDIDLGLDSFFQFPSLTQPMHVEEVKKPENGDKETETGQKNAIEKDKEAGTEGLNFLEKAKDEDMKPADEKMQLDQENTPKDG